MQKSLAILAALSVALATPAAAAAQDWIAGWTWVPSANLGPTGAPSQPNPNDVRGPLGPSEVANQTLSQALVVTADGDRIRIRVSNLHGAAPVRIGAASVSVGDGAPAPVTFDGAPGVTLPAGASRLSDPVVLPVRALDRLTVSTYLPDPTPLPVHRIRQVLRDGDATGSVIPADASPMRLGALTTAVEVETDTPVNVIVAFGDSITEGTGSLPSGPGGWPERLARRMVAADAPWAVINAGIGGNRLLYQGSGPSGLQRLDSDALAVSGARCLILLEGINDLGRPARPEYAHEAITAADLIAGYRQVLARAHAAGFRVVLATLPPFEGANYFTATGETIRQAANAWIRTSGEPDAVIDFDAAVRDPEHPQRLLAANDSGDRLHPSDAGYAAMAEAIQLTVCD
ncbi:SGNH/GDSL hydrolase family protein [Brevundimonas sp.]|uniref:SGNH/GDSL hydrolase family protein n=1 Tax=Brevundimonas sp. TaxID=1871086 RepID=UPI003D0A3940